MSIPDASERAGPGEPDEATVEFLLRIARVAHRAGYPTADLEERLSTLATSLGLKAAQISATPTQVELSFGALPDQRSYTLRVRPKRVDLDAIGRVEDLIRDVMSGQVAPAAALDRLAEIENRPLERPWYVAIGAYGLAGAAVAPVLGGAWREAAAGGIVGLLVGCVAQLARRKARAEPMVAPLAAVAASLSAAALTKLGLDGSPDTVTLAALVTFLPGMSLTIGVRELATEQLQSGVANTANALIQLLGLVFGVGVGRSLATHLFGVAQATVGHPGLSGAHVLAAIAAGLAFTVTLSAPYSAAPVMCMATGLAVIASAAGKSLLGPAAGTFIAALAIGIVGSALAQPLRRPALAFIVPGVLMLVPGSTGFTSVLQLLTGQTVSGIDAGFNAFVTAIAISYGLMASAVIFPPRALR